MQCYWCDKPSYALHSACLTCWNAFKREYSDLRLRAWIAYDKVELHKKRMLKDYGIIKGRKMPNLKHGLLTT